MFSNKTIVIRGGGDLATGIIQKFFRCGFNVLVLEIAKPTAIRRSVALCQAVCDGESKVEDMLCRRVERLDQIEECWKKNTIPLVIDPEAKSVKLVKADGVIDAIIAKHNTGTTRNMAKAVIGAGPGFQAGVDVDIVIETKRGHDLGRLIFQGAAAVNTGLPGEIDGRSAERVIHSPAAGVVYCLKQIGDIVEAGEPLFTVGNYSVCAPFRGLLRGTIQHGLKVPGGCKIADIDPRTDVNCSTISDKARNIGGAALEAFLYLQHRAHNTK